MEAAEGLRPIQQKEQAAVVDDGASQGIFVERNEYAAGPVSAATSEATSTENSYPSPTSPTVRDGAKIDACTETAPAVAGESSARTTGATSRSVDVVAPPVVRGLRPTQQKITGRNVDDGDSEGVCVKQHEIVAVSCVPATKQPTMEDGNPALTTPALEGAKANPCTANALAATEEPSLARDDAPARTAGAAPRSAGAATSLVDAGDAEALARRRAATRARVLARRERKERESLASPSHGESNEWEQQLNKALARTAKHQPGEGARPDPFAVCTPNLLVTQKEPLVATMATAAVKPGEATVDGDGTVAGTNFRRPESETRKMAQAAATEYPRRTAAGAKIHQCATAHKELRRFSVPENTALDIDGMVAGVDVQGPEDGSQKKAAVAAEKPASTVGGDPASLARRRRRTIQTKQRLTPSYRDFRRELESLRSSVQMDDSLRSMLDAGAAPDSPGRPAPAPRVVAADDHSVATPSSARQNWRHLLKVILRRDPRYQILKFFDDLAFEGVDRFEAQGCVLRLDSEAPLSRIVRAFARCGCFSVWRPTSYEAIHKMVLGQGVGKGLDIKGKSAKAGKYSGYVPFLQITNNEDKAKVPAMTAGTRLRVFYPIVAQRDAAIAKLRDVARSMSTQVARARDIVREVEERETRRIEGEINMSRRNLNSNRRCAIYGDFSRKNLVQVVDYQAYEDALDIIHRYEVANFADGLAQIEARTTTGCAYGIEMPEKVLWEGYVTPADISREKGSVYDTGRQSMPEFQLMNLTSMREWQRPGDQRVERKCGAAKGVGAADEATTKGLEVTEDGGGAPRPVLWFAESPFDNDNGICNDDDHEGQSSDPLCPLQLLMAYEVDGGVLPVVSDFDCFLLGTRGVRYQRPLQAPEQAMLHWCVDRIESILAVPQEGRSWTQRWLAMKKTQARQGRKCSLNTPTSTSQDGPNFGYADPTSYAMMRGAVARLKGNGAVRHGETNVIIMFDWRCLSGCLYSKGKDFTLKWVPH